MVGQIVRVTKGPAFVHEGDDELRGVDFDDPAAVERAIDVHARVSEIFGPEGPGELPASGEVALRWGGLGRLDGPARAAYIAAMAGMGRIVAFLQTRADRDGEVYIPVLQGALLGQVTDLDELKFRGLGDDERAFIGSIRTPGSLRHLASADRTSTRWDGPLVN